MKRKYYFLQVNEMNSKLMNTAIAYGFYYAPVFSYYYYSTGSFAWEKSNNSVNRIRETK